MGRLCPECGQGKHGARYCAGWTLDAETDAPIDCECACNVPEEGTDQ